MKMLAAFVIATLLATTAQAGGGSGGEAVSWSDNQRASVGSILPGLVARFLTSLAVWAHFDPVGTGATAYEVAETAVDQGIRFKEVVEPRIPGAVDLAISLYTNNGTKPVETIRDLEEIQFAARSNAGVGFDIAAAGIVNDAVERELEERGLNAY